MPTPKRLHSAPAGHHRRTGTRILPIRPIIVLCRSVCGVRRRARIRAHAVAIDARESSCRALALSSSYTNLRTSPRPMSVEKIELASAPLPGQALVCIKEKQCGLAFVTRIACSIVVNEQRCVHTFGVAG
jgi:hypothetical protein